MSDPQLGKAFVDLFSNSARAVYRFAKKRTIPLIGSAVVVLIGYQAWSFSDDSRQQDMTFLVGSTNSSENEARKIQQEMKKSATALAGKSYVLKLESTSGYEENRERINEEGASSIGFAYDGFGDSSNVNIVLPMDKRYLHILCTTNYVKEVQGSNEEAPSTQQIFNALKTRLGRVYLGTSGSATRQCAEIVLKHFGVEPDKARCHGVGGFDEMRAALNTDHIVMAFSSTVFNSERIAKIARDGKCILLGLNDERDAIVQENPHLLAVNFQRNSYLSGDFCPKELESIGARRVIICSKGMSTKDVYTAGMGTISALRETLPEIEWETPPLGSEQARNAPLRYSLHVGAKLIRDKQQPTGQPQWLFALLATAGLWIVAEAVRGLNYSLFTARSAGTATQETTDTEQDSPNPAAKQHEGGEDTYTELKRELEHLGDELRQASTPMSQQAYTSYGHTLDKLQDRILDASRMGTLSRDQTHILLMGLTGELAIERNLKKPGKRSKAKSKIE